MILKSSKKQLIGIVISFVLLSLFSIFCFSKVRFNALGGAADIQFHLRRVLELKESISHGHLLPEYSFNLFYGSSIMSMYPYLSVYPFALLMFIVPSIIKSYYIFVIYVIFTTLLISFLSSLRFSKSVLVSYIFSVTYGLSSTFMFEFFNAFDLGRATALAILPLSIFGFIDILNGSANYLKLSFGLVLLMGCQIPAFIIVVTLLIFWAIININYLSKDIFLILSKAVILSALISSIIWIPIIHTMFLTKIYSAYIPKVLISPSIKQFIESVGLIAPISLIISLILFKKFNVINKQMYVLAISICFLSSSFMPWNLLVHVPIINNINHFQDSFRFLMIPQIFLCYLFSVSILYIFRLHTKKIVIYVSLFIVIILQLFSQAIDIHHKLNTNLTPITSYRTEKYYMTKSTKYFFNSDKSIYYIIHGYSLYRDYYPIKSIPRQKYINNNNATYNNEKVIPVKNVGYNKLLLNSHKYINRVTLPLLHYGGEKLQIYINHHLIHYYINNNLITLKDVKKGKNVINIKYIPNTLLIIIKYMMFLIGAFWIIFVKVKYKINLIV